ncbi:MAG: hypothetical protein V4529_17255 [Gemmatimonadota bacterium]
MITDRGGGLYEVTSTDPSGLALLDPSLFTAAGPGATGTSLSNVPYGSTLQFDLVVVAGDVVDFAGTTGWLPGSFVVM